MPDIFGGLLLGFGIPPGPFQELVRLAILGRWTPEQLLSEIYSSPAFDQMFPGIFGSAGQLKMMPGEYLQARESYMHMARVYGFGGFDNNTFGQLIAGNVGEQEFVDRLEAGARIRENAIFRRQFQKMVGENVAKKDMFDYLLGLKPKEFYDKWEQTVIGATARLAGVSIGMKGIRKIQKLTPGRLDEATAQASFQELAQHIKTTMPLSKIHKFGLTKGDLITLEFGGKRQAEIAEKARRVLATEEAFQETRATEVFGPGQQVSSQQGRAQVQ